VKDKEIDEILRQAPKGFEVVDASILERIGKSIESTMKPVRPWPPTWMLAGGLASLCVAVAVGGAARAGFHGVEKLSALQIGVIFPALLIFILLAALSWVSEMIPGSRRVVSPKVLLAAGGAVMLAVFGAVFHDYHAEHFVASGAVCLMAGLLHAIPTGLIGWLLVRRGFAVNAVAAGFAAGTLAGLAGLGMLELHCVNLEAPHVMVWHTAVVVVSGMLGAAMGWAVRLRGGGGSQASLTT
jgi:hypothetical protein